MSYHKKKKIKFSPFFSFFSFTQKSQDKKNRGFFFGFFSSTFFLGEKKISWIFKKKDEK